MNSKWNETTFHSNWNHFTDNHEWFYCQFLLTQAPMLISYKNYTTSIVINLLVLSNMNESIEIQLAAIFISVSSIVFQSIHVQMKNGHVIVPWPQTSRFHHHLYKQLSFLDLLITDPFENLRASAIIFKYANPITLIQILYIMLMENIKLLPLYIISMYIYI